MRPAGALSKGALKKPAAREASGDVRLPEVDSAVDVFRAVLLSGVGSSSLTTLRSACDDFFLQQPLLYKQIIGGDSSQHAVV
jgi:hypothetical protein